MELCHTRGVKMDIIRKMGKKWQAVIRIKKRQLSKSFEKKHDRTLKTSFLTYKEN